MLLKNIWIVLLIFFASGCSMFSSQEPSKPDINSDLKVEFATAPPMRGWTDLGDEGRFFVEGNCVLLEHYDAQIYLAVFQEPVTLVNNEIRTPGNTIILNQENIFSGGLVFDDISKVSIPKKCEAFDKLYLIN